MDSEDAVIIRIFSIPPSHRSPADITYLHSFLRTIEGLNVPGPTLAHRDAELRELCRLGVHRRVPEDVLLYRAGELCDSWFILLTGSVLIETSMFLPRACFGLRINGNPYRSSDCLVLEPSDLVVFRYPDREPTPHCSGNTHRRLSFGSSQEATHPNTSNPRTVPSHLISAVPVSLPDSNTHLSASVSVTSLPQEHHRVANPSQHIQPPSQSPVSSSNSAGAVTKYQQQQQQLSDTSSLSSSGCGGGLADSGRGSSFTPSTVNGGSTDRRERSKTGVGGGTGNESSLLDSDEEDDDEEDEEDFESGSHESLRDAFWESILKEPSERTAEDVQILMDNVQQLPAFSNLTKTTCRALCAVMLVAVVHDAGQVVLTEDEKLDTWSVVLNGTVEVIEPDGTIRELTRGDAFGVRVDKPDRTHRGVMRTVTEDCQFVWVPQADYVQIMSREGEAEIPEMGEGGRVVLVYENLDTGGTGASRPLLSGVRAMSPLAPGAKQHVRVVTKGTPEKLIEHLVADLSNMDITYPEDFLLTYRTFLDSPRPIVDRLLSWHMHSPRLRARVNRIILLWVHNHFNDFEDSVEMMRFVEKFDEILSKDGTAGERRLFQLACSTKARVRQVEFDYPVNYGSSNSTKLPFSLIGGHDGFGIFISQVDPRFSNSLGSSGCLSACSSRPHLRRADQLLAVNGRSVDHLTPYEVTQLIQSIHSVGLAGSDQSTGGGGSSSTGTTAAGTTNGSGSIPATTVRLLVVFNPVQYHQLVTTLDYNVPIERCSSSQADQTDLGSGALLLSPTSGTRKMNLPSDSNVGNDLSTSHFQASSLYAACQGAAGRRQSASRDRRSADRDAPSVADSNRPRSAHTSPTRTSSSKFRHRSRDPVVSIRQTNGMAATATPDESRVSPKNTNSSASRLSVALRPQRSSSQPDLLATGLMDAALPHRAPYYHHSGADGLYGTTRDPSWSVIRVWRAGDGGRDQTSKLVLLPRKQTNALEATRLAVEEFGMPEDELDSYGLYHVTVEPGPIVKQSRLANTTDDLPGRLTLNARYYLKHNRYHDPLVADDVARAILTESRVTFVQLAPEDLATRLTLDDYEVFRAVQSTEYIDEVFGLTSVSDSGLADADTEQSSSPRPPPPPPTGYATGHENLDRFTELVNREAYWAPTEICNESNLARRVDLLKRFIKLAKLCRELRNFNTMFCILVGLHQTPVERLKQTWERLPNKYQKLYRDLSMILDTSRNFFQYRTLLTADEAAAPMLPYLPLVLKDLTFVHLGNPSRTPDGLINFVKLRMLAKEIRAICRMCNVDYDLAAAQRLLRRRSTAGGRATRGWVSSSKSNASPAGNTTATVSASQLAKGMGNGWGETNAARAASFEFSATGEEPSPGQHVRGQSVQPSKRSLQSSLSTTSAVAATISGSSGTESFVLNAAASVGTSPLLGLSSTNSGGGSAFGRRRSGGFPLISSISASSSAGANPKKLYESWLVTLRIRTYLANLNVIRDPDTLSQLSARLEPGAKAVSGAASGGGGGSGSAAGSTTALSTSTTSNSVAGTGGAVSGWSSEPNTPSATPSKDAKSPVKSPASTVTTATTSVTTTVTGTVSIPTSTRSVLPPGTTASPTPPTLVRPILGAQSVEDARKLLALGEYQKRSHQRIPAFTFPTHRPPQFVFVAPPAAGATPHAGVGVGQLQYAHVHQQHHGNWPAVPLAHPASQVSCPVPHSSGHATGRMNQPTCYTLVGSKTLLLDNLIPMPQRIGPAMRSAVQYTAAGGQRLSTAHYATAQQQQQHQYQQQQRGSSGHFHSNYPNRISSQTRHSVDRKSTPQPQMSPHGNIRPGSTGTSVLGTAAATRSPPTSTTTGSSVPASQRSAALGQFVINGDQKPVGRGIPDTYHYPTANTTPLGLTAASAHSLHYNNKQITAQRISQQQQQQQQFEWKPNRPPPYELALALRQMQSPAPSASDQRTNVRGASHSRRAPPSRALSSGDEVSGHAQARVPYGVDRVNRRGMPPQQQQQQHPHHPPGAPRPAPDASYMVDGGSKLCGGGADAVTPCSPPSRLQQQQQQQSRPAPPSYQQVVSMTRYGQQQQHRQQQQQPSERPLPPTRTTAVLSNQGHVIARQQSLGAVPATATGPDANRPLLRPSATTVSSSEPRSP